MVRLKLTVVEMEKKKKKKPCKTTQLNEVVANVCSLKASSFLNLALRT